MTSKQALKVLWDNAKTTTVKSTKATGKWFKQVGKAVVTNPNKKEN